ncbi:MAG: B12-binding domain-containing radical SAM protein [Candidatus Omnitrophota bacterium]
MNGTENKKILLMTLPFLTPLIPPVGISCLKSYLQANGFEVKTIDVMAQIDIRERCYRYFETLERFIPENKRGFYFNIALDVFSNHFMARQPDRDEKNFPDETTYTELVNALVYHNFDVALTESQIRQLTRIIDDYYVKLETYLSDLLEQEHPSVVGLSIYKGTLASSMFTGRLIREKFPRINIVAGGTIFSQELFPHTPNFNRFLEKASYIDKIFIGEGERLFLKYLQGELPDDRKIHTLNDLDGTMLDLNALDIPDYSDFDLTQYPMIAAYTSRGCVYRCSFCAETVYWKQYHRKEVPKIADEFSALHRRYQRRVFVLTDCLINPIVTELSNELIARDSNLYWDVYLKVDSQVCDPDLAHRWRRGGFYRARLGVESGSQHVLDLIKKGITVEQIKRAIGNLASAGIKTTTYWIAGHPGETESDFQETLRLLEELQDDLYEAECDPFRYFYMGQVDADRWAKDQGNRLVYPKEATDRLVTQTWQLNASPSRQEVYDRNFRFKEHCRKLGIPNPYSLSEIQKADERWRQLHKNAVPPLLQLNEHDPFPNENKNIIQEVPASPLNVDDVGFRF